MSLTLMRLFDRLFMVLIGASILVGFVLGILSVTDPMDAGRIIHIQGSSLDSSQRSILLETATRVAMQQQQQQQHLMKESHKK